MKSYKGIFRPRNPEKYKGDAQNIIWRSSLELRFMKYLDENTNVIEWSSEEVIIPYISPKDGRYHRYFPDFVFKVKDANDKVKTIMVEVKPKSQTMEPKKQSKKTRKYLTEVMTWGVNQAKWKAAEEYCKDRLWEFKILTEEHLGVK